MHGQGTLTWADGEKYVGGYKDGYRHGQGTHTLIDGSVRIGTWSYDNFQGGYDDTKIIQHHPKKVFVVLTEVYFAVLKEY